MSIFLNEHSKVIVQGMTGAEGTRHTTRMLASGTNIVGGVNPRKAGERADFDGRSIPVSSRTPGSSSSPQRTITGRDVRARTRRKPVQPSCRPGRPLGRSTVYGGHEDVHE